MLGQQSQSGELKLWTLETSGYGSAERHLPQVADRGWQIQSFRDQEGDGKADLLWRHQASGQWYQWHLQGERIGSELSLGLPRSPDISFGGFLPRQGLNPGRLIVSSRQGEWGVWSSPEQKSLAYVHTDHLGSPRLVTDAEQKPLWQAELQPFGELMLKTDQLAMPLRVRYPGQYQDDETGLYYNAQRYYDPKLARYLTPDPIGLDGGLNPYAYAESDPVNKADPSGLMSSVQAVCLRDPSFCLEIMGQVAENNGNIMARITGENCFAQQGQKNADSLRGIGNLLTVAALPKLLKGVTKKADGYVDLASPQRRKHILDGDATGGGHRPGTGKPGKSEFPQGWSDDRIMHNISDVATDPNSVTRAGRGGRTITEGTRDGINIRVIQERNEDIVSAFPINVPRNP